MCCVLAASVAFGGGVLPVWSDVNGDSDPRGEHRAQSAFRAVASLAEFTATAEPFVALAGLSSSARGRTSRDASPTDVAPDVSFPLPVALPEALLARPDGLLESPDRARFVERFGLVRESLLNPYAQSTVKGDRPIFRDDWYLRVGLESSTTFEAGELPRAGGRSRAETWTQKLFPEFSLIRGMTTFRPPDWRFHLRAGAALQGDESLAARAASRRLTSGQRSDVSIEELFVERHLFNVSERYDFQSLRVGIQPFVTDFRGFLLDDQQPAVRWFGNADNNRIQHNVAWIRRLEKDPISGLNTGRWRDEDLLVANVYLQDFYRPGFQVSGLVLVHLDRERDEPLAPRTDVADASLARSRGHDAVYLGASGDGHLGRINLTFSTYAALGRDRADRSGRRSQRIGAYFGALEASMDFDWYRLRAYGMLASGDSDPDDDRSEGFDFVRDQPTFAGLEDGFWQRESLRVTTSEGRERMLVSREGLLPSLRSPSNRDSASFVNPGLRLAGVGADFDVLPELRLRLNASYMEFDDTASLRALRSGRDVARHLGEDYSLALIYRPWFINNVIVRVSAGALRPGSGLLDLGVVGDDSRDPLYSARVRLTLTY